MALVKVGFSHDQATSVDADLLAVGVTTDDVQKGKLHSGLLKALDKALSGVLSSAAHDVEFEGKPGSELTLHTHGKIKASRLVLLGLGKAGRIDRESARQAAARAVKSGDRARVASVALVFPFRDAALVEAAAEGAQLGAYRFDKYLSEKKAFSVRRLDLVLEGAPDKHQKAAVQLGTELGAAVNFARDLVNEPASVITPSALADAARTVAREGKLHSEILEQKDIKRLRMGMFLGVAQGSAEAPKLIHLWWDPGGRDSSQKPIALIGKAITFDSGGLSLKTASGMETMKTDMAGSAAVFGTMKVVAQLKPPFPVHAFVGACENMPSGTAQRPGDIVRARNGKTVEVLNTDAEGRLVLGDVLAWATEHEPAAMIDLATLTGAIITALGPYSTGVFSPNDALADEILAASKGAGEEMWRMPLPDNMKDLIKSPVADLKNTGGPKGGAITAALFLREFVGDTAWAHLDIAGPSFLEKDRVYDQRGATGVGVRTLVELIRRRAQ
jgi:leucyl aminopeptidase